MTAADAPMWQSAAWLLAAITLVVAARRLPWFKLQGDAEAQRVLGIALLMLVTMRWVNTHGMAGVNLHFLGAAIATLMFGPAFALCAMALVSAAAALAGFAWLGWAADFLVTGALPIAVTVGIMQLARRFLPAHLFVYVFVNAFAAGALSMAASMLCKAVAWQSLGTTLAPGYWIATVPMMFAEAFFTGGIMVLIVVYRPQWCASFDDARYLRKPEPDE